MLGTPSSQEAAAIVAAIERFRAEVAAEPGAEEAIGPWQRAALVEGVGAKATIEDLEGGGKWLS